MRTKSGVVVAAMMVLLFMGSLGVAAAGISEAERTAAIEAGLTWLEYQQEPGGYFEDPAQPGYCPVALTAFAVLKFEDHAARAGVDPFDPGYRFHQQVLDGWEYLVTKMYTQPLSLQGGGDPEQYTDGDGNGTFFSSGVARDLYETGIVMMALQASNDPTRVIPGSTLTFYEVLEDCVDWVAWAQTDAGYGRGGWDYVPHNNTGDGSDNSITQWPVIGLMAAEAWGIDAPDWVRSELEHYWLATTQNANTGCYGYTGPTSVTAGGFFATTAAALINLTYCGVPTTDPRWANGAQCICTKWNELPGVGNIENLYAMYGLMKAAMLAEPDVIWDFCGHEWQPEYDRWLIDNQVLPDGYWMGQYALPWNVGAHNRVLATEFALLILQKIIPPRYDPLASFEDLLKRQGDLLQSFEDLLKLSWEELDRLLQLEFLESFEDLLRSRAELIQSFEDVLKARFDRLNLLERVAFLRSFETLLKKQAELLASFEDLLKAVKAAPVADADLEGLAAFDWSVASAAVDGYVQQPLDVKIDVLERPIDFGPLPLASAGAVVQVVDGAVLTLTAPPTFEDWVFDRWQIVGAEIIDGLPTDLSIVVRLVDAAISVRIVAVYRSKDEQGKEASSSLEVGSEARMAWSFACNNVAI